MKKVIIIFFVLIGSLNLYAQEINIIPKPAYLKADPTNKSFKLDGSTKIIISSDSLKHSADFLNDYLKKYFDLTLRVTRVSPQNNFISLNLDKGASKFDNAYTLLTSDLKISIVGTSKSGIFYGVQTLIQLLPTIRTSALQIPAVAITDYPRFDYRGMHLDVSRHFFDVAFVKKYIDYLAMHKMNYFHWHLTDDHGWRIEIKKYPKLTEIGAWRSGTIIGLYPGTGNDGIRYGGYYTQEQIKDVVEYASKRYITIIPEIEMPAHSLGVLASYPEFGTEPNKHYEVAQTWGMFNKFNNVLQPTQATFTFLENVLDEVMALFPSKYIHIGGDEASKTWWKQSPVSQRIMKENGLKSETELQSYFIHKIEKFVNSRGKTIIGWNEILQGGLAPNAVVMSWQGETGGIEAAKQKQYAVMTPEAILYFNHAQFVKEDSLTAKRLSPLINVYNYEIIPKVLNENEAKYIWGGQGCLWTEYITNPSKLEYMLFPRLDALSEILWSAKDQRNYPDFRKRLKTQFKRYDLMGVNYSKKYL